MADLILQTQGVDYEYPSGHHAAGSSSGKRPLALCRIDMKVPRGARLALLGANGAGKTTLVLQLNGTLRPTGGTVLLDEQPADYSRRGILRWRQRVGLVFQDPDDQLFAASVQQDVSFGPLNLGLADPEVQTRVDEALAAMGISELAESPTHLLSFGQKKRAAIAGVLAMRPEVIILDEPTAGLDPSGIQQLLDILESLRASGTTIVISTHDVDMAYSWADEAVILSEGQTFDQGIPDQVMRDEDRMRSARLRVPWVLAFANRLRGDGQAAPAPMPRTFDQLFDEINRQRPDQ